LKKVSISTFSLQSQYDDFKTLELAKAAGADAVDFYFNSQDYRNGNSIYNKGDDEIIDYYQKLKDKADEIGIEICMTHGRGDGFKNDAAEDAALIENARRDCLATSVLGAKVCVIHSVTTIFMGADAPAELMHKLNFDMYCKILEFAKQYNILIATETFGDAVCYECCDFFGNIDEFIKSYNAVCAVGNNAEYFKTCVDTGHSNKAMRYGNPKPADVIRMLGDSIVCLHLHDNDTFTDQHKIPMTGVIDWSDVMKALEEVSYNGYYNLEVVLDCFGKKIMDKTARFSVEVMRNILENGF